MAERPRLPPRPDLDWRDDGTPSARAVDDVYYTAGDGLEESRAVFLKGCGLPEAWAGRRGFTVAELGFGTGLNLLALWDLWRRTRPAPDAWLTFVSFEGFPLDAGDAARALAAAPELAPLAGRLLAAWPERARGTHLRTFTDDGVRLVLHVDDVADALPQTAFSADAWFLDGFSPARNPQMWAGALWPLVAARTAPGGRLATFTVAGAVRRGLAAAGFEVAKRPGHGRKRERLEARLAAPSERAIPPDIHALASAGPPPQRVAILGAGIAGASAARAFADRGVEVTVFDAAPGPAGGASGNPLALVMPRLDAADTVAARVLLDAYLAARAACAGRPGVSETDVVQRPRDDAERQRFARVLADPPLGLENLEAIAGGGLLHKRALILEPARLIPALLGGAATRFGAEAVVAPVARSVNGEVFDAIILASGLAVRAQAPWLGLEGRLGQVEWVEGDVDAPPSALAAGHYALALGDRRLWGATFERHDGPAEVRAGARSANAEALQALDPWWRRAALAGEVHSRAGVRATTPDRLPVAGPLPDIDAALDRFSGLRTGQAPSADAPRVPGVYLAAGLGSRGFTLAPWIAALLVAQAMGDAPPSREPLRAAVSPMRVLLRSLKRSQI